MEAETATETIVPRVAFLTTLGESKKMLSSDECPMLTGVDAGSG